MPRLTPLLVPFVVWSLTACREERHVPDAAQEPQMPSSTPAADVSHGEAPIGGPEAEPAEKVVNILKEETPPETASGISSIARDESAPVSIRWSA